MGSYSWKLCRGRLFSFPTIEPRCIPHLIILIYALEFLFHDCAISEDSTSGLALGPVGPNPKAKETLLLTSPRSRAILGSLDILVDIGVPAEKEVIQ